MWIITITHPDRTVTQAQAVTREDARRWARQYRATGDRVTITNPTRPCVSERAYVAGLLALASADGGDAPCSRYGTRVADYAPWAVAGHLVMVDANGSDDTVSELDYMIGLVVNDQPVVAGIIAEHWHVIPRALRQDLGGLRNARALAES